MTSKQTIQEADQVVASTYSRFPVVFTEGKGCILKDADGRTLHIRKSSRPEPQQLAIYDALGIDPRPGRTEKTVM